MFRSGIRSFFCILMRTDGRGSALTSFTNLPYLTYTAAASRVMHDD